MLERRVLELGLGDHVEFDDRFLSIDELSDLLAATDVFVTPYRNREQIASGALTFALAAGCGVVSTPYWYAQDMLASGAGRLVPVRRSGGARRRGLRVPRGAGVARSRRGPRRAGSARRSRGRRSRRRPPPSCARRSELAPRRRPRGRRRPPPDEPAQRPPAHARRRRRHRPARARHHPEPRQRLLRRRRRPPRRRLARARAARRRAALDVDPLPRRSPSCTPPTDEGGMRNFMSYDRRWLDEPHVGDHVGRSVWALGEILATAWIPAVVEPDPRPARPARRRARGRRLAAHGGLHGARALAARPRPARPARPPAARAPARPARRGLRAQRDRRLELVRGRAQLRQRAPPAGADRRRRRARPRRPDRRSGSSRCAGSATSTGSTTARCACRATTAGSEASRLRAAGDEQPLDAAALVEAELAAFAITGDPEHGIRATRAFEWFLGRNRLQKPLYDFATGGCSDGLGSEALNQNEGAESTLALHRAALLLDAAGVRRRAIARSSRRAA